MDCLILHDITRQTNQDFMQLLHRIRIVAPDERDIAWMHDNMTTIDDVDFNHTTVIVVTNLERQDINNHAAMMISDPSSTPSLQKTREILGNLSLLDSTNLGSNWCKSAKRFGLRHLQYGKERE